MSDRELCEPGLVFWLVEELLDSQTIDGCRIVFDYLDSRRDRLTAKHFKQKNLIILRSCNELLRRLSRAEDTVFCGRVFIFLFQSFPLGDKSSVNLRGEYHVENVTSFEEMEITKETSTLKDMEVGVEEHAVLENGEGRTATDTQIQENPNGISNEPNGDNEIVITDVDGLSASKEDIDMNRLYTTFWSLQESFSQPTKLFDDANLASFKDGLDATLSKFRGIRQERPARGPSKMSEEGGRGVKRKRGTAEDELSNAFNPKYLTSRDLFDLEVSDLAFRRHILVQALILIDFLLSLTPKAKKKLDQMSNRSVLYGYTLDEDNAKWATNTRNEIASYLQDGPDGKFYYRMVDTVLSRDKNWTYWKAEACPPIEKSPISAEDFSAAMKGAQRACVNKKLRSTPIGTLDLSFLANTGGEDGLERLKDPARYAIPTVESFERPLADDQFEIDMARTDGETRIAQEAKSSKLWRTLRIASKTKLGLLDKIDDGKKIQFLFHPEGDDKDEKDQTSADAEGESSEARQQKSEESQGTRDVDESMTVGPTDQRSDENDAGVPAIQDAPALEGTAVQ